ncbi:MAG: hypothetical protein H8D43_03335 [Chloroflexi bacterium]|nr:hypothetical protein [Chloroflexota bacterium]
MDEQDRKNWLEVHLPYRLQAVDGLRWVSELLLVGNYPASVEVFFDGRRVISSTSFRFLTNPMLEAGVIFCRVLLEFLGVSLDNTTKDRLKQRTSGWRDAVKIEDFRLLPITVEQVRQAPTGSPDQVEEACAYTILTAHKAIAHLTPGPEPKSDVAKLHLCSLTVPWLVCEYVYRALELPEPRYKLGLAA